MGRQHRPSKADRQPVTRRYVARCVQRARDEILAAIVHADHRCAECGAPVGTYHEEGCPIVLARIAAFPGLGIADVPRDRLARIFGKES
jgi:hypothetical protein